MSIDPLVLVLSAIFATVMGVMWAGFSWGPLILTLVNAEPGWGVALAALWGSCCTLATIGFLWEEVIHGDL